MSTSNIGAQLTADTIGLMFFGGRWRLAVAESLVGKEVCSCSLTLMLAHWGLLCDKAIKNQDQDQDQEKISFQLWKGTDQSLAQMFYVGLWRKRWEWKIARCFSSRANRKQDSARSRKQEQLSKAESKTGVQLRENKGCIPALIKVYRATGKAIITFNT